jgi:outer membrane protein assembly factor BamB
MNRLSLCFATAFLFALSSVSASAQDSSGEWTQFRGTNGTGVATAAAKPPTKWTNDQLAWSVDIPGTGWSSPVYDGKHLWITSAVTEEMSKEDMAKKLAGDRLAKIKKIAAKVELHAICVDIESGKLVHDIKLGETDDAKPINPMNSYASPTPAIRDGKVICHFGSYGTWCLDSKTGKQIWNKKYVVKHSVGPGSSPIIVKDKVILVCDGTDLQFIVGLDLATGEEAWKTDRPPIGAADGEFRKAYSTPLVITVGEQEQAVIPGAQWIASYEPETGKEIWRVDHGKGFSVTPMAIYESGLVIFSTGYMQPEFVAVDPSGTGDVTTTHVKWRRNNAPTMPSLIGDSGRVYSIHDKGIMRVLDAKTGEELNRDRVGGNFSSSPLLAGGNLYLSSREGKMTIINCSADLKEVGSQDFESSLMATPVLVNNDLVVRTEKKLVRIKGSSPKP